MNDYATEVIQITLVGFEVMLKLTLLPLSVLVLVGLVIGFLLTVLQIQEQSLTISIKILMLIIFLVIVSPAMAQMITDYTKLIFEIVGMV